LVIIARMELEFDMCISALGHERRFCHVRSRSGLRSNSDINP
jgi:hypothetical protein